MLTFGIELEWPDVDRSAELPNGWSWSKTDYTIVNSDGTANDPLGKLPLLGGEINSPVFDETRLEEFNRALMDLYFQLDPGSNYRSNFHVHVGFDEFDGTPPLALLKDMASWHRDNFPGLAPSIDQLDHLLEVEDEDLVEAHKRYRHSLRSRRTMISEERHSARLRSESLEEFLAAECPVSRDGIVQWHLASREALNFRALRKHGTIEHRYFANPRSPQEVLGAVRFALNWTKSAMSGGVPPNPSWYLLPIQQPFDAKLEAGWRKTNLSKNKRSDVARMLKESNEN